MRGVYLRFIPSSEGQRKLVPKLEGHVSLCYMQLTSCPMYGFQPRLFFVLQVILPALSDYDVLIQVKACALSQINTKVSGELIPVGLK